MELARFLKLLHRYRLFLIAVPFTALLVTYFLTRKMPDLYLSETDLSTGIIDQTQQIFGNANADVQESKASQQFSNLIQTIRLGKVIDQVSYSLIIHDLTSSKPFRPYSKLLKQLNYSARLHALGVFRYKYLNREPLDLTNQDENGLNSVLEAQKYDAESIRKDLSVYRTENSDFVHLQFTSEQPQLSAFTINAICEEFIAYTSAYQQKNKNNATEFLQKLVGQKLDTMNAKVAALRNYKIRNQVLDLKDQSNALYGQLTNYRDRKAQAEKEILSYNSAIANIDSRFDPNDRRYLEANSVKINGEVAQTRDRLAAVNNKYIQTNFDARYKKSSDSIQSILNTQIAQMADKYVANPLAGKESLVQEKVKMEITRDMAKSGLRNLDNQISKLSSQLDRIVPFDAAIQSYERDIDVATKEYLDVQNKYNQSSIEANLKPTIKQVETAMPGAKQPSKKLLLTLFSGVVAEIICLLVFFIMFYADHRIKMPLELANATLVPVLGQLNLIVKSAVDYKRLGNSLQSTNELQHFKNLLRSIRYEIDSELRGHNFQVNTSGKILAVTSLNPSEGKSLVAMSLASAYAMANKKVLVVDGNFDNPSITKAAHEKAFLEDFLKDDEAAIQSPENSLISVLGNHGGDYSLLEKSNEKVIRHKIGQLKSSFDIIIIETQALSLMNKAKEWIQFSDQVIAVFEAEQSIDPNKQQHINYLRTLNGKFAGFIMNKVVMEKELEVENV